MSADRAEAVGSGTPDTVDSVFVVEGTDVVEDLPVTTVVFRGLRMVIREYGRRPVYGKPGVERLVLTVGMDIVFNGKPEPLAFPVTLEYSADLGIPEAEAAAVQAYKKYEDYIGSK